MRSDLEDAAGLLHMVVIDTFQVWELHPSSLCTEQSSSHVALIGSSIGVQGQFLGGAVHVLARSVKQLGFHNSIKL